MVGYPRNVFAKHITACVLTAIVSFLIPMTSRAANAPPAMIVPGQFNVSSMGAFTYTIPIAVPPGTAGMIPHLTLDYSSSAGDGIVGLRWKLGIAIEDNSASENKTTATSLSNKAAQSVNSISTESNDIPASYQQPSLGSDEDEGGSEFNEIDRCPRTLAQDGVHGSINFDSGDRFCIGGQRLILVSGTYGATGSVYRFEIDDFSRITAYSSSGSGPKYFLLQTRSGQKAYFGNTSDSRAPLVPVAGSTTGPAGTVRAWGLNEIVDTKGNYLTIQYNNGTVDTANGQIYPTKITYTGNAGLTPYNSVQFSYAMRPDQIPFYQAGSFEQMTVLLSHIKTYAGSNLVSDYQLTYAPGSAGLSHDHLTKILRCDAASSCLAPTTIDWQGGTGLPTMTSKTDSYPPRALLEAGDFNGDGITDVGVTALVLGGTLPAPNNVQLPVSYVCPTSTFTVQLGTLSGSSFVASNMTITDSTGASSPFCGSHSTNHPGVADVNGDGYTDMPGSGTYNWMNNMAGVMEYTAPTPSGSEVDDACCYAIADLNGDGLNDVYGVFTGETPKGPRPGTRRITTYFSDDTVPGKPYGTFVAGPVLLPDVTYPSIIFTTLTADFDGDGCADFLTTSDPTSQVFYSCDPAQSTIALPANFNVATSYYDQFVLGDFNGDGKTDILLVGRGNAGVQPSLYLSTGTGFVLSSFAVPADWHKYSIVAGDWNADGMTDIALIAPGSVFPGGGDTAGPGSPHTIWLSTGNGFVQETSIANNNSADGGGIATYPAVVQGWTADWNSDGASDLWLSKPSGNIRYLFGYKPEVVTSISDGLGASTTVTYDKLNNSTIYTKGSGATYPTRDVTGSIYVVTKLSHGDGIGGTYDWTYQYAGAQKDSRGRGFLGFSSITKTDQQTSIVETTTYRHDFPYTGEIVSEVETLGGVTLSSTVNTYNPINEGGSTGGTQYYFVPLQKAVVSGHDLDGTLLPTYTTNYSGYDSYGNPGTIALTVSDGSSRTVTNTFTNDTTNWILGQILTSNTRSTVGPSDLTRHLGFAHDASSGLITQKIVEPSAVNNQYLKTAYAYDNFGNQTTTTTSAYSTAYGSTRTTAYAYDTGGEFPVTLTNALSQSTTWGTAASPGWDARFGVPTAETNPNNLTAHMVYDTFGRITLLTRDDGNKLSTAYAYCSGVNGGSASCPTYGAFVVTTTPENSSGTQNGPQNNTYYDALGRVIAFDVQGFSGGWIRTATQYDANLNIHLTSKPYFTSGGTAKWTTFTRDALGRVTQAAFPDASKTTYAYHGLLSSITNDKNQTTTTTKNAQGLTASVMDANHQTASYVYDAFGDLTSITDPSLNVTTNTFDIRGNRTASSDPDMGGWSYGYDAYAEITSQIDAKSQTTTLTYDLLGRVLQRVEPDLTSNWVWGTSAASHNIGNLASACTGSGCTSPSNSTYFRSLSYDNYGRPSGTTLTIGGTNYSYTTNYNGDGRIDTTRYPSELILKYAYQGTYGYLSQTKDNSSGLAYWTVNARDAEMHLTQGTYGNGVVEAQSFDANTGLLQQILAGASNAVANFSYTWDTIGNLTSRADANEGYTEKFCYDALNRLTDAALGSSCSTGTNHKIFAYDVLGNIISKTGIGLYTYGGSSAGPHAVTSIAGTVNGVTNPVYGYDANGNQISGDGRTITPMSFNMAGSIVQGTDADCFTYDSEHNRIEMDARVSSCAGSVNSSTIYLNDSASGAVSEAVSSNGTINWHDYIIADGHMIALRTYTPSTVPPVWGNATTTQWSNFVWTASSTTGNSLSYFTNDNLGSISVLTDANRNVTERDSYDAWGLRRNPNGTDAATCGSITSATTRGFTAQEHLGDLCAINFNARVYDPSIARFMSPDPIIQPQFDVKDGGFEFADIAAVGQLHGTQALNRYTYVGNDPTNKTDPTGMTCTTTQSGNQFCQIDQVVGSPTKTQQQQISAFNKSYTDAVNELATHPDRNTIIRMPVFGPDSEPTGQFRTTTVNAGDLAKTLEGQKFVARLGEKGGASTVGGTTTVRDQGLSGKGTAVDVPSGNAELLRQVVVVHEGLHAPGTHTDDYLAPGGSNQMGTQPYQHLHQRPYNDAAMDLLGMPY